VAEKRLLYFGLGVLAVVGVGAVTNQVAPVTSTGLAFGDRGIIFPDATVQTTAAGSPDPPCFDATRRFVDCGNGTVTDTTTGLIYLKNANCFGQQDWVTANESAAGLADGACGLTDGSRPGDWRLQTADEWEGILDPSCANEPKIIGNQSPTPGCYVDFADPVDPWASGVQSSSYWSFSSYELTSAWIVPLNTGIVSAVRTKTIANYYVWPVRGGQ
jgi:hypothetical protein